MSSLTVFAATSSAANAAAAAAAAAAARLTTHLTDLGELTLVVIALTVLACVTPYLYHRPGLMRWTGVVGAGLGGILAIAASAELPRSSTDIILVGGGLFAIDSWSLLAVALVCLTTLCILLLINVSSLGASLRMGAHAWTMLAATILVASHSVGASVMGLVGVIAGGVAVNSWPKARVGGDTATDWASLAARIASSLGIVVIAVLWVATGGNLFDDAASWTISSRWALGMGLALGTLLPLVCAGSAVAAASERHDDVRLDAFAIVGLIWGAVGIAVCQMEGAIVAHASWADAAPRAMGLIFVIGGVVWMVRSEQFRQSWLGLLAIEWGLACVALSFAYRDPSAIANAFFLIAVIPIATILVAAARYLRPHHKAASVVLSAMALLAIVGLPPMGGFPSLMALMEMAIEAHMSWMVIPWIGVVVVVLLWGGVRVIQRDGGDTGAARRGPRSHIEGGTRAHAWTAGVLASAALLCPIIVGAEVSWILLAAATVIVPRVGS